MEEKQNQKIDRYIIRRVLGTGAMGSVYAAWDPKLHREVALKVVPSRLSGESKGRERFQREARAIAAVRHPNIVEIYDYSGTDSEYLYLVIEKLDGEDLYATLHRRGLMGESVAAAVGHELCLALQVAHGAGIIHRDLKPENVFLNRSGRVVLTDFGIVKAVRGDSAVDGYKENTDVIGTPGFMAPELMNGRGLGPPIDIFALGALLYNITTNRLPYEGATPLAIFQAASAGNFDDPRKYNPQLSEEFCAIIASCLHPNPRKRPRNAEMVRLALKTVIEDNGVSDVRDDLHDYMQDTEAYRQSAQKRAVKHLVQQIKVAIKDHDSGVQSRLRKRLLVLDPYNDDLRDVTGVMESVGSTRRRKPLRSRVTQFMSSQMLAMQRLNARKPQWVYAASALLALGCVVGALSLSHGSALDGAAPAPVAATTRIWPGVPRGTDGYMSPPNAAQTLAHPTDELHSLPAQTSTPQPAGDLATDPPAAVASRSVPVHQASPKSAWVEVRVVGGGANLVVDGQALGKANHRSVQVVPGRHVVDVMRHGRRLRRVINLAGGDRVALRVDVKHQKMNVQ